MYAGVANVRAMFHPLYALHVLTPSQVTPKNSQRLFKRDVTSTPCRCTSPGQSDSSSRRPFCRSKARPQW